MTIRALYDSADDVPEPYRDLFEERDGKFQLTKIEGIATEADVSRMRRALDSERNSHKDLKTRWTGFFGERKPEDVQALLDRLPELETLANGKVDETKLNELAEARARGKLAPVERKLTETERALQQAMEQVKLFQTEKQQRTIGDAVRAAAVKGKMLDTAQEDALLLAERVFEVTEDGKVMTRDGLQNVPPGLSPDVWLSDMQKARPHWWPASSGGGARGGSGNGSGGANPFSADGWNLTEQGRVIREQGAERAAQLARVAGTTVGGPRPVKK